MPSCEPVRCNRFTDPEAVGHQEEDLRNGPFINSYGKRRRRETAAESDRSVEESAEKYAVEEAQLAFQNVFEEEVEEAMQDGLRDAFHLAVHSLFGKRKRRSADGEETTAVQPEIHQEKNLLLVQSIRISDRFGPERRESTDEGQEDLAASCMDTKGLAFGSAAFLLAQVALMVAWVFLRRGRGGKKEEDKTPPMQVVPPREVLYHSEAPWVGKRQRF
jgi:hypothetical protein